MTIFHFPKLYILNALFVKKKNKQTLPVHNDKQKSFPWCANFSVSSEDMSIQIMWSPSCVLKLMAKPHGISGSVVYLLQNLRKEDFKTLINQVLLGHKYSSLKHTLLKMHKNQTIVWRIENLNAF